MPDALPLAHAGHWLLWVAYLVPVVIVLAATARAFVQQRREDREHRAGQANRAEL